MEIKYQIHAKNEVEKSKIVDGLINSGYIIGVEPEGNNSFVINIYNRILRHYRVYEDCDCQKQDR